MPQTTSNQRLTYALAAVLFLLAAYRLLFPFGVVAPAEADRPAFAGQTVTLVVEQPTAESSTTEVPWSAGQSVADATAQAGLEAVWRGSDEMAFLESLVGVANQGGDGLNWQFEVNGTYADRGAGAIELEPGDRVLWKLAPYE